MIPGIKNIQALIITVIIFVSGIAQAQTWQQVPLRTKSQQTAGLAGGEGFQMVFNIKYAPSNPNIVYLVTDTSQVWKSIDGGANWVPKHNGYKANGAKGLGVDPNNPNVVFASACGMYAGTEGDPSQIMGIYRTQDGGDTWTLVKSTKYHRGDAYCPNYFVFIDSNTIYAGTVEEGILKSTNGGTTWTSHVPFSSVGEITDLNIHPADNTIMFAATTTGLKKITTAGVVTNIQAGSLPRYPVEIRPTIVTGNLYLYANCNQSGVYRSTNGGTSYSAINSGMTISSSQYPVSIGFSPANPDIGYVNAQQGDFYYTHTASSGSVSWLRPTTMDTQNADGWVAGSLQYNEQSWGYWYGGPIACHPTDANTALIQGGPAGVKKTTNGGDTFGFSGSGFGGAQAGWGNFSDQTSISFDTSNPNRFALFFTDMGAYITEDGGAIFRHMNAPDIGGRSAMGGVIVPGTNIVMTAIGEWKTRTIVVTRNANSLTPSWDILSNTAKDWTYFSFFSHPGNNNIVYADNLKFTNIKNDNTFITLPMQVKAMFRGNGDIVYSNGAGANGYFRIYKSTNGGSSWTNPYQDIPVAWDNDSIGEFVVDPQNQDIIYVAVKGIGLYKINGSNLTLLTPPTSWFNSIDAFRVDIDPNNSDVIYVGYDKFVVGNSTGIYRSVDGGATWTWLTGEGSNIGAGFMVTSLTVNPHNGYIFAGSPLGTWKLPPSYGVSEPSWTLYYVDSEELVGENGAAINAFDGNVNTFWHSKWYGGSDPQPHEIQINLGTPENIGGFKYLPRQDGEVNGRIGQYEFYVSTDGTNWGSAVGTGTFANDDTEKTVTFGTQTAKQYIRLKSLTEANGQAWTSMAEISLITGEATSESVSAPLVITSAASNVTYTTATLNGQVNPSGLQSTYRWQYGTSPSSYSYATGSQTVATGTAYVNVSDNIISLLPGITYYMRCQANNGSGTTDGSQTAFSTIASPQLSYDAAKTGTTTITVDGLLTDWPALTNSISKTISGSPLSTGTGSALWNNQYLYVAVSASDSILYDTGSTNTPYVKDGIDIYIDRDHNQGSTYDGYDLHVSRSYNNSYIWSSGTNTGILGAGSYTANTYNIEMAIPWAIFPGGIVPGSGTVIGFDFQINDNNGTDGVRLGAKSWNNPEDTDYFNPSGFGEIVLTETQSASSQSITPISNCIARYPMDNIDSDSINDIMNTYPGTMTGAIGTSNTKFYGSCKYYDGIDNYGQISGLMGSPPVISVSCWVKLTGVDDTSADTVSIGDYCVLRMDDATEKTSVSYYDGTDWLLISSGENYVGTGWHHLCYICNPGSSTQTFYVDGVIKASGTSSGAIVYTGYSSNTLMGKHASNPTRDFKGYMDEVSFYNKHLTAQEVIDLVTVGSVTVGVGTPTSITQTSATLMGTITPNGSSTFNGYFRLGTQTGNYGFGTTTEQYIGSGTTPVTLSKSISGLSQGTTYYFVPAAYNAAGVHIIGSESSFTTLNTDVTAPVGTITINSNGTYTTAREVILNLSATDAIGITGYFVSENSDVPYGTQTGWVSVVPSPAYSEDIQYTLTTTDETKTVYVWYKDGAGNISDVVSDAIILDTTFPNISVNIPVHNCWMSDGIKAFGTTGSTIFIAGSSTDANGITLVQISNSATTTVSSATGTESWSLSRSIITGTVNTFRSTAKDTPTNQGTDTMHVGAFPMVSTTDATTIARNSVMLNGSCSANLNTSTVWFEYGIVSGTYIGSSTTTQLTGDTETAVNIALGALNKNTEYFYRIRGSNLVGETYGEEFSFTTLAGYTLEEVTGLSKPLSWSLLETTKFLHGMRNYGIYNWKAIWRSTKDRQDLIDDPDTEITEALEDL